MRRVRLIGRSVPALLVVLAAAIVGGGFANGRSEVRSPAVAGSFYPAEPAQLAKTVDALLSRSPARINAESIVAIIAPHAGYEFSGGVAARSYAALRGARVRRVVVIAKLRR